VYYQGHKTPLAEMGELSPVSLLTGGKSGHHMAA